MEKLICSENNTLYTLYCRATYEQCVSVCVCVCVLLCVCCFYACLTHPETSLWSETCRASSPVSHSGVVVVVVVVT